MTIRKWLFATTMLMLPLAAKAQVPQEPVLGIYIGAAGSFNIQTSQAVNNNMTDLPGAAGLTTPNTSVSTGIGAAAVGTVGYGLGNGFRVELAWGSSCPARSPPGSMASSSRAWN